MDFICKFNEIHISRKINLGNYESKEIGLTVSPVNLDTSMITIEDAITKVNHDVENTIKKILDNKE